MASVKQTIREIAGALGVVGIPEPSVEAEIILMHILGVPRHQIVVQALRPILYEEQLKMDTLLARRKLREPLPYLLGHWEFYGLDLLVDRRALIPRQETELLVDAVLAASKKLGGPACVVDVGTGSGAIALAVAQNLKNARVIGVDVSTEALGLARANAIRHCLLNRVQLIEGDLLGNVQEKADIIVANLPYIPSERLKNLQPEVQWEPLSALDGGPDGLAVIRRLLEQIRDRGLFNTRVLLEIDCQQGKFLTDLALKMFPGAKVDIHKDLGKLDRIFEMKIGTED